MNISKITSRIMIIFFICIFFSSCIPSFSFSVLKSSKNNILLQCDSNYHLEAQLKCDEVARNKFGSFTVVHEDCREKQLADLDCSYDHEEKQGYVTNQIYNTDGSVNHKIISQATKNTNVCDRELIIYWSCVMEFRANIRY